MRTDAEVLAAVDGAAAFIAGANGNAPMAKPCLTPAEWACREIEPADHLLGELFSTTCRAVLVADTGLGKTMFAMAMAFAMHLGRGFLRWSAQRPAQVLFIDGEMPRDLMKERIAMACLWFGIEPPADGLWFLSREDLEDMPAFDTEEGQKWLDAFIARLGRARLRHLRQLHVPVRRRPPRRG